jgi:hypothetical protein
MKQAGYHLLFLRRSAFNTTEIELNDMAAPAIMGDKKPAAAAGMQMEL